jgi:hypothetical protein
VKGSAVKVPSETPADGLVCWTAGVASSGSDGRYGVAKVAGGS